MLASPKQIVVEKSSAVHQQIVDAEHDGLGQLNNDKLTPEVGDPIVSMAKILNGTYKKSLLVGSQTIEFMPEYPCDVGKLDLVIAKRSMGMLYQKNWPFTELFNWHLHQHFIENGILNKLLEEERRRSSGCSGANIEATKLTQTFLLFGVLAMGVILTLATLIFEVLHKRATRPFILAII